MPRRGQAPPGTEPLPREIDLAVVGPMARSAADLRLALDVIAGPDEEASGTAYRLVFPPPRHDRLHSYRVLIIDQHPLGPTSNAVRMALERLSDRLARAGARVAHSSPVLPDLARSARLYMRLLSAYWGAGLPPAAYDRLLGAAEVLSPRDRSLAAERARGAVLSHRDWLDADLSRAELRQRWRELFREWDVVLCPATPTPAFPHDHSLPIEARRLRVDGKLWPYIDAQLVWATVATTPGLPATVVPTGPAELRPADRRTDHRPLPRRCHYAWLCRIAGARIRRLRAAAGLCLKNSIDLRHLHGPQGQLVRRPPDWGCYSRSCPCRNLNSNVVMATVSLCSPTSSMQIRTQ